MLLDQDETLTTEVRPDKTILVIWFFTKTIPYSIVSMFFIFMALFFFNTVNATLDLEEKNVVEVSDKQSDIKQVELKSKESKPKISKQKDQESKKYNPFDLIINYWIYALTMALFAFILVQTYLIYLRQTYRYVITDRRCIFIGGILKRIERTVPYKKITDIQRSQNIIERLLGIWNVQVFTPGTASIQMGQAKARAELNFDGLTNSEALYQTINKYTQLNG